MGLWRGFWGLRFLCVSSGMGGYWCIWIGLWWDLAECFMKGREMGKLVAVEKGDDHDIANVNLRLRSGGGGFP